jgi:hypothetical protein
MHNLVWDWVRVLPWEIKVIGAIGGVALIVGAINLVLHEVEWMLTRFASIRRLWRQLRRGEQNSTPSAEEPPLAEPIPLRRRKAG